MILYHTELLLVEGGEQDGGAVERDATCDRSMSARLKCERAGGCVSEQRERERERSVMCRWCRHSAGARGCVAFHVSCLSLAVLSLVVGERDGLLVQAKVMLLQLKAQGGRLH